MRKSVLPLLPGVALCCAVGAVSMLIDHAQAALFGQRWVDGLVFAIVLGSAIRSLRRLDPRLEPGIGFSAKAVLELAIVLLGATISFASIARAGAPLFAMVAGVVLLSLLCGYWIARALGLNDRLATLVACGNSICGNSAIVAAAPAIDARSEEVAASVAFTAALGILVVLLLPLAGRAAGMDEMRYGVLAGMTVYAVPQVLAATAPVGPLSVQVGAVVKIVRVLMLGPVVMLLGLRAGRRRTQRPCAAALVPWFIVGFIATMALASMRVIPAAAQTGLAHAATALTVVAMAALGLSVDVRSVLNSGGRVLAAGSLSLLALAAIAAGAIHWLL